MGHIGTYFLEQHLQALFRRDGKASAVEAIKLGAEDKETGISHADSVAKELGDLDEAVFQQAMAMELLVLNRISNGYFYPENWRSILSAAAREEPTTWFLGEGYCDFNGAKGDPGAAERVVQSSEPQGAFPPWHGRHPKDIVHNPDWAICLKKLAFESQWALYHGQGMPDAKGSESDNVVEAVKAWPKYVGPVFVANSHYLFEKQYVGSFDL